MRPMRTKLRGLVAGLAGAVTVVAVGVVVQTATSPAQAAAADTYTSKNAQIDGGGFVPGIVFNRTEKNLAYARTDIGGAYRWDQATKTWTPLLGLGRLGQLGPHRRRQPRHRLRRPEQGVRGRRHVHQQLGPEQRRGPALRRPGRDLAGADLPFKLGGNMPGRGMGERLAVDPNRNSVLYLGAPSGNGLWRSAPTRASPGRRSPRFPNPGNYAQDPADTSGYASDNQGIVWVTFDESHRHARATPRRRSTSGVADKDNTVYRSTDGGATWSRLAGQPTGYLAHKGVLDAANGYLYLADQRQGRPVRRRQGPGVAVRDATGIVDDISPVPSSAPTPTTASAA